MELFGSLFDVESMLGIICAMFDYKWCIMGFGYCVYCIEDSCAMIFCEYLWCVG